MEKHHLEGTRAFRNRARVDNGEGRCICGATSKGTGKPCPLAPVPGRTRCQWHGGRSTGPRTEEGKQAARENGRKGGRPRKHALPVDLTPAKPEPVAVATADGKVSARVLAVRCRDCANLSAGYSCLPAARGELGAGAEVRPSMSVLRDCSLFTPLLASDKPQ